MQQSSLETPPMGRLLLAVLSQVTVTKCKSMLSTLCMANVSAKSFLHCVFSLRFTKLLSFFFFFFAVIASRIIQIAVPPLAGQLVATPSSGVEGESRFEISALRFESQEGELRYTFFMWDTSTLQSVSFVRCMIAIVAFQ